MPRTIVANWKMNGGKDFTAEFAVGFLRFLGSRAGYKSEVVVCPPSLFVTQLVLAFQASGVHVGGQDASMQSAGACTGDISAQMLKDAGAAYVILGHSERRQAYAETSAQVRKKAEMALAAGLTPIICVGESAETRGNGNAVEFVVEQLLASIPDNGKQSTPPPYLLAYEPLWAIGSGRTPTVSEISAMHAAIKSAVAGANVLYGGSVNAANAGDILGAAGVDGALIGGASLQLDVFCAIVGVAEAM